MTARQMRWAATHDWYVQAGINEDGKTYTVWVRKDTGWHGLLIFTDFNKLYTWAGY